MPNEPAHNRTADNSGLNPVHLEPADDKAAAHARRKGERPQLTARPVPAAHKGMTVAVALSVAGVVLIILSALTRELRFTLSAGFFCIGIAQLILLRSPVEPVRYRGFRVFMAILVLILAALNIWQPWGK